jgi:hypothetical protein
MRKPALDLSDIVREGVPDLSASIMGLLWLPPKALPSG